MKFGITLDQLKQVGSDGVIPWGHNTNQGQAQERRDIKQSKFKKTRKSDADLHGGYAEHTISHFSSQDF